ncbi:MAG: hypothetical protein HY866_20065 [Chloroflexi bacterium]|nr:hypothetical protein [Chloroflexota bacterium]
MSKKFFQSKKFVYALCVFLAQLLLVALPSVVSLDQDQMDMLSNMIPTVFVIGGLVITGHAATDIAYAWLNRVPSTDLSTAAHNLVDAFQPEKAETISAASAVIPAQHP